MELIEGEIRRREALIQAGTFFAEDHREVAQALRIVLEAYKAPPAEENMRLIIPFSLPGLNEYIEAERGHRQKGAKLKRDCQTSVILALRRQIRTPLREPVFMRYLWVEKNRRRDKDNVSSFGRKVIQDALVKMGALKNDGWENIEGFSDSFAVDKGKPRIEIEIEEPGEKP